MLPKGLVVFVELARLRTTGLSDGLKWLLTESHLLYADTKTGDGVTSTRRPASEGNLQNQFYTNLFFYNTNTLLVTFGFKYQAF